jgi:hypothetical protein
VLPPDEYVASLARKRMAATGFFRDEQGRVLLVNPVYKEMWDLPGGAVEAEESPHAACRREVAEELGLDRPPDGRPLVPSCAFGPGKAVPADGGAVDPRRRDDGARWGGGTTPGAGWIRPRERRD